MKTLKAVLALSLLTFAFAGFAQAEDKKPAGEPAKCCAKAAGAEKACTHSCCVDAGKAGKQCEKCGGTNAKKS